MTDEQRAYWQAYVDDLKPMLRLSDWRLRVSNETTDGENIEATIHVHRHYHQATIDLHEKWSDFEPENQRAALTHELIHCHLNPLSNLAETLSSQLGAQASYLASERYASSLKWQRRTSR